MTKNKRLSSAELTQRIIDLPALKQFSVNSTTERGLASGIARTLRMAGRIEFQVTSRKQADGFVFFIVPT